MIYSDPTNKQGIVQDIDWWAGTNENTYTIEDKTRNANQALSKIGVLILKNSYRWTFIDDNSTDFYVGYTSTTANVDNIALEIDHLYLERVRIKVNNEWSTLTPKSRRQLTDQELDSVGTPRYYYRQGQSLVMSPVSDQAYEVEVEWQKGVDFFAVSDTTKSPGFNPDFHRLVSLYAARDYVAINDQSRYNVVVNEIQRMEQELETFYSRSRARDEAPALRLKRRRNIM